MADNVPGIAVGTSIAGLVLVWSGLKGKSVSKVLQAAAHGQNPQAVSQDFPISGGGIFGPGATVPGTFGASATGSAIAADALQYKGAGYVWDGAPANGIGNWDCSSFCNWVIGHDEHMAIPGYAGGTYTGTSHGPSSFIWAAWNGCTTVGHSGSVAEPGDLCIWMNAVGHIGIATGGGQMISALDTQQGTQVTPIDGTASGLLIIRRLNASGISTGRKK